MVSPSAFEAGVSLALGCSFGRRAIPVGRGDVTSRVLVGQELVSATRLAVRANGRPHRDIDRVNAFDARERTRERTCSRKKLARVGVSEAHCRAAFALCECAWFGHATECATSRVVSHCQFGSDWSTARPGSLGYCPRGNGAEPCRSR